MTNDDPITRAAEVMDKNFNPDRYPVMAAMFKDYAQALADADLLVTPAHEDMEHRLSAFLCEATGGLLSKTGYDVCTMVSATDDAYERCREDESEAQVTGILAEVATERTRQDAKWGEQNHPDGTGPTMARLNVREHAQSACDRAQRDGTITWRHILTEELAEAFAENDPGRLREELVQVAAVAAQWAEAIDRRIEREEEDARD